MATTKISTGVLKDGSVTSAKLDTNISIVGDLTVDTNTLFVDSASNRVGVGTSSPSAKLDVEGLMINGSTNPSIMDGGNFRKKIEWNGALNSFGVYNTTNAGVDWQTNLLVESSGNVGIGTSSPTTSYNRALHINDPANSSAELHITAGNGTTSTDGLSIIQSGVTSFVYNREAGNMIFGTSNTERMRIDSSGNVGIGTTPSSWNSVYRSLQIGVGASISGRTDSDLLELNSNSYRSTSGAWKYITSNSAARQDLSNGEIRWYNAPSGTAGDDVTFSERMRIDANGNVGINTTNIYGNKFEILQPDNYTKLAGSGGIRVFASTATGGDGQYYGAIELARGTGHVAISAVQTGSDSDQVGLAFFTHPSIAGADATVEAMRLQSNGDLHVDGDVIAYSTTISDQRLKDDVQTIDNALDKVSNLRGVSYTWNNGNRKGQKDLGLIAQEVEQVLPELVREKEMPMIDGETYKTVDYEKIVGVLIEAVKELKNEIESLKSK